MNRREFSALVGAGLLFPQKLWGALFRPQLPTDITDDDHVQHYPIYFARSIDIFAGDPKVYQLWQPGIIMADSWALNPGAGTTDHSCWVYSLSDQGLICRARSVSLFHAIMRCPAHGLVVDGGYAIPYRPCGPFRDHPWVKDCYHPLLLGTDNAKLLVLNGNLRMCEPYCSLNELCPGPLPKNFPQKLNIVYERSLH